MYSQNNEETTILSILPAHGRFLDIGALDGRRFSNTMALAERGWSGVCVEPDPESFANLMKTHRERPGIKLFNVALAPTAGVALFHSSIGDCVSTLVDSHRDRWQKQVPFQAISISAITPADLLLACPPHRFDFLSLDVEGMNLEILHLLPLDIMGLQLACVEHEGKEAAVKDMCAAAGLTRVVLTNKENILLARPA